MFSMKRGLVSPDVLFTFGFTFRKSTDNTAKYNLRPLFLTFFEILHIYQVIYDSSNLQRII